MLGAVMIEHTLTGQLRVRSHLQLVWKGQHCTLWLVLVSALLHMVKCLTGECCTDLQLSFIICGARVLRPDIKTRIMVIKIRMALHVAVQRAL